MFVYSAVEQLAIEFSRAGADVTQTFSFWCHEDALPPGCKYTVRRVNKYKKTKLIQSRQVQTIHPLNTIFHLHLFLFIVSSVVF